MVDSNQFRQVAENVAYRFEDRRYSVSDEYGDHAYTSYRVVLLVFPIIKRTRCGMWIGLNSSYYPTQPYPYRDPVLHDVIAHHIGKRFVNLEANKKFALPTIQAAAESYIARKSREVAIYESRIRRARKHLAALSYFLRYETPTSPISGVLGGKLAKMIAP